MQFEVPWGWADRRWCLKFKLLNPLRHAAFTVRRWAASVNVGHSYNSTAILASASPCFLDTCDGLLAVMRHRLAANSTKKYVGLPGCSSFSSSSWSLAPCSPPCRRVWPPSSPPCLSKKGFCALPVMRSCCREHASPSCAAASIARERESTNPKSEAISQWRSRIHMAMLLDFGKTLLRSSVPQRDSLRCWCEIEHACVITQVFTVGLHDALQTLIMLLVFLAILETSSRSCNNSVLVYL